LKFPGARYEPLTSAVLALATDERCTFFFHDRNHCHVRITKCAS